MTAYPSIRKETRSILGIAVPLTAAYVAEMGMVITDMVMVGRIGSNELAAVGLAGDLFWMLLLIGMGVIAMVGVIAAQNLGANNARGVISAGEQGMIVATVTSLPIMLCVWLLGPLLALAQQDPLVVDLASSYARALTLAVLPALWFVVLRNYITALAHSAAVGWIMFAALALNPLINYALIFGKLGIPALGVVGAGIGTTVVNYLMFAALAAHVLYAPQYARFRPRLVPRRADSTLLREIFRLGIPNAATQILNGALFSAAALIVGAISAAALAAQQIMYTALYIALSAAAALADAVRVRVAFGAGRGNARAANQSAHISLALGFFATLVAALPLWLFPDLLISLFLDARDAANSEVVAVALSLSAVTGVFLLLDGTQMVTASAIKGLRDTRSPLLICIVGYWLVGLGAGMWLCFPGALGVRGLWFGLTLGVLVSNLLMYLRFRQRIRGATLAPRGAG